MLFRFVRRSLPAICLLSFLYMFTNGASAQNTQVIQATSKTRRDIAVSAFAQYTGVTNGNFIHVDNTISGGGLLSFRQVFRPWLGYEANFGYTHFTDNYSTNGTYRVPHNMNELSLAYLAQSPPIHGVQIFGTLGAGAVFQSPTVNTVSQTGGTGNPLTLKSAGSAMFVYSLGFNFKVLDRVGVRVQSRQLHYRTPQFGQVNLNTHATRTTIEPSLGVYYRF